MASRAAVAAIDFARLYTTLGLGKETIAGLQAFRKRHETLPIADEAEKVLNDFKPVTYDVNAHVKAIETFAAKAVEKAEETAQKIDVELKDLQVTLANIEDARPFEDLTVSDFETSHPRLADTVDIMVQKGKFSVPGYKEKFGDLSLV
ncbi:ATP7, subunit D of the stator stalk of mitochondrial F1F0 ATP synthase [Boletus reticuloceps]|uniref:ATP7, subunit D of the stator stalk of mitochondrial F1F0 ATP synthase n=1 Tax=Boletus reticuloceps TaxID=495285 RepID=A0A8I2YVH7_9AGAM|nr:ATP7, subunit D of the stator stalk of mitochondrial F1F0 ATP synthase [Boletus reticuloceps]